MSTIRINEFITEDTQVLQQQHNSGPPHHDELNFNYQLSGLVQLSLLQHSAVDASDILCCAQTKTTIYK